MEDKATLDLPRQDRTASDVNASSARILLTQHAWLWLLFITVVACALRAFRLGARSLNMDEAFGSFYARVDWAGFFNYLPPNQFIMLLYYLLLRAWVQVFPQAEQLRILSVIFGSLTVPAIYLVARRAFGTMTALTAAVLLAVNPLAIRLSQAGRSYSLAILLVTLAGWSAVQLLKGPSRRTSFAFAASAAAAVYAHFLAILTVAAQSLIVAWNLRRRPASLLASQGLLALLLVPLAVLLLASRGTNLVWLEPFNLKQLLEVFYALTLVKGRSLLYVLAWWFALAVVFRPSERRIGAVFCLAWLVLPIVLGVIFSLFRPVFVDRYLSFCLPASVLLAAVGVARLSAISRAGAAALLGLIILHSASSIRFYFRHVAEEENWRGAIAYMLSNAQSGDELVIEPFTNFVFDYYRDRRGPPTEGLRTARSMQEATTSEPAPATIWFMGRGSDRGRVNAFLASQATYCETEEPKKVDSLAVWKLRPCGKE